MKEVMITGSGLYTPPDVISNEELVESFNKYVDEYNKVNKKDIESGLRNALLYSNTAFIEKASGILSRHVLEKEGVLDINVMHPLIHERPDDMLSIQAEYGVNAANEAMKAANKKASDIDAVIVACSSFQRSYPAISIEVQAALGIDGFAFDMNVACSSATFAIRTAESLIKSGAASTILVITPEVASAIINFRDRDSHFIFGDAATALILEGYQERQPVSGFKIVATELKTIYSNNIRSNSGFMDRLLIDFEPSESRLFSQNGRKVFKEVTKAVLSQLREQTESLCLSPDNFKRVWLHQANINMNRLIASKFLGETVDAIRAPVILDKYGNTGSAGSIVAFHHYHDGFDEGEYGLLCSFGAGYSIGSVVLQKIGE
jgi:beta-ketodecanoyl-[acyl-carrier-protein] synthase